MADVVWGEWRDRFESSTQNAIATGETAHCRQRIAMLSLPVGLDRDGSEAIISII